MSDLRLIYAFGNGRAEGDASLKPLLGGKGAGLAVMTSLGLPVPPGFTITTEACTWFFQHQEAWHPDLDAQVQAAVSALEACTGKRFSDATSPLLVSVRSGAAVSMPGMMDTVLNLGLNDATVAAMTAATGNARFAWDSYRRFVQMFGEVVLGIHYSRFGRAQSAFLNGRTVAELDEHDLKELTGLLKQVIHTAGLAFPQDPVEQLRAAITAVFKSYNSHRARYYRKTQGIADDAGTAVNVQAMVFGNFGEGSGTGVAFTRNPKDGEHGVFGEWLPDCQGEDLVSGSATPLPLVGGETSMKHVFPEIYEELVQVSARLEGHFRDMQDVEFTIEDHKLWMLQTRTGKRSPHASVRIVVDMVQEGLISRDEAILRVEPRQMELVLRPVIAPDARRRVLAKGLDASPGAACGRVVFHSVECQEMFERDEPTILVRKETSPEDIQGMTVAQGVLTARGGQTSHAAVVARGMGKPCVVGCSDIQVDYSRQVFYAGDTVVRKGEWITIDGATGEVMAGQVEMLAPQTDSGSMSTLLGWADDKARLQVRANADNGQDAARARQLGAVGIGLCRTEHMFFQAEALHAIRRMILADDPHARQLALNDILPLQRQMFIDIFRAMHDLPVTIRLLDPPLHEFLPSRNEDVSEVAEALGVRVDALLVRLERLEESNPMLGHRGVRLGVTNPEVYRTQVRAIFEAACQVTREGVRVLPEVMIPLVALPSELVRVRELVVEMAERVIEEFGVPVEYTVGTMIELPRAALLADELAEHAEFFSFGTNDLTQMVYGLSRDDMNKFFPVYQREGLMADSPLSVFDVKGVGQLVRLGTELGRSRKKDLKVGICGEHGGDPTGVAFFHAVGLDYVSCSPFRVPVARLAAAHAALLQS